MFDARTTKESVGTQSLNHSQSDQESVKQTCSDEIKLPYEDKRKLRFGRLQNKLKYILVKDEATKKASACCYVRSGSLNDPKDF